MLSVSHKNYDELFNLDNLFSAWQKFRRGKIGKIDILEFEAHLEDNLFDLYEDLRFGVYKHSGYQHFEVFDHKKRDIHKAKVRDRVVHHLIYDYLTELFEPDFISDSYASRLNKGQYRAINTANYFGKLVFAEHGQCYVLKCDVKKYFDNINQEILLSLIEKKVSDVSILSVIKEIIYSYNTHCHLTGIPLGNVTSQIFANIYLNVLDIYVKKELKCRFYVRYNDDFVIFSESSSELEKIRAKIIIFVREVCFLTIPLEKTSLRKFGWGVDFLGFTLLPGAILLRNKTKEKIYTNINNFNKSSYLSILKHCNSYHLRQKILAIERLNGICYDGE